MKILSLRKWMHLISRDVVYEYEDELSKNLKIEIAQSSVCEGAVEKVLQDYLHVKPKLHKSNDYNLFIAMNPYELKRVSILHHNIIPMMLDVYEKDIEDLVHICKECPLVIVTAYDTYKIIRDQFKQQNFEYLPLSIADKFTHIKDTINSEIDIVQVGRQNAILHQFALEYSKQHNANYVYRIKKDNTFIYVSTINPEYELRVDTRDEYTELLRKSKVSLVSTPGQDNSRSFGESIDFFTPRWFESAACGCYIIGKYTDNDEAKILHIKDYFDNVTTYEQFKELASKGISIDRSDNVEKYKNFISDNLTSRRAESIKTMLKKRGIWRRENYD